MLYDLVVRRELLEVNHNNPFIGHFSISKIVESIQRKYFWPELRRDVKDYVKTCLIC